MHVFINRRRNKIVLDLRRWTNDDDLVFERRAVVVIRVPDFIVENLPKRLRLVGIRRAESDQMRLQIFGQVFQTPDFFEGPTTQ